MQITLADFVRDTPEGEQAEAILRKCVHCGFCTATCPTYQLLGDELDGPRGRIYLIKQVLEGHAPASAHRWPQREHPRKVLLLMGCVQPAMLPNINSATARVLDAAGIQTLVADEAGCCGAIRLHLDDQPGALEHMRRNIDAWWPQVSTGAVEAIVMNASGCGVTVKEYGRSLAHDPAYAKKAERVADLTCDVSELLPDIVDAIRPRVKASSSTRLAFHPPCTLQHGQRLKGGVETALTTLGFDIAVAPAESHLCCGSAGTYSVLQPALATAL